MFSLPVESTGSLAVWNVKKNKNINKNPVPELVEIAVLFRISVVYISSAVKAVAWISPFTKYPRISRCHKAYVFIGIFEDLAESRPAHGINEIVFKDTEMILQNDIMD